jgi:hypothetical protein
VNEDRFVGRLARLEQQIRAFKELHANELQLILDELADIKAELVASSGLAAEPPAATPSADPAAGSAKRARWVAEQERKARPLSRRELLRGREEAEP